MSATILLAVAVMFAFITNALSWPQKPSNIDIRSGRQERDTYNVQSDDTVLALDILGLDDERAVSPSAGSYFRKPDCFRHAAAQITVRCDEIATDESSRVRAAISMTLCELKTAQHRSLPLECEAFSMGLAAAEASQVPYKPCVNAISRSAQFWASYSGYLREIPQLCFAYQKSNGLDTARELYRNATLEKVAFLHFLAEHAKNEEQDREQWRALVSETQGVIRDLHRSSAIVGETSGEIGKRVQIKLEEVFTDFRSVVGESQRRKYAEDAVVLADHSHALSALAMSVEQSVTSRLDSVYGRLEERLVQMYSYTDEIATRYSQIYANFTAFSEILRSLTSTTNVLTQNTNTSAQLTREVRTAQGSAARSTAHLAEVLQQLTLTAQLSLADINDTASAVKLGLGTFPEPNLSPRAILLAGIHAHSDRIWLQIGWYGARMVWFILCRLSSSPLMACFVVVLLPSMRWTSRRIWRACQGPGTEYRTHQPLALRDPAPYSRMAPSALVHGTNFPSRRPCRFSRIPDRLCRECDKNGLVI